MLAGIDLFGRRPLTNQMGGAPDHDRDHAPTGEGAAFLCGMRVSVSDPELVPDLLAFLRARVHVTAEQVGVMEIEVSQLGSMNAEARRLELDLMLQVWRASHENARTRILD